MEIKKATPEDFPICCEILEAARKNIKELGIDQWQKGSPSSLDLKRDIEEGTLFTVQNEGEISGFCYLSFDGEPLYEKIYDGSWLSEGDFCVIHRVAVRSDKRGSGVFKSLVEFAEKTAKARGVHSLKIDTHRGNIRMRNALKKNGFLECGVIFLETGEERIGLEKVLEEVFK